MMAFSAMNLSRWVKVRVKEFVVTFANFGHMILIIFLILNMLTLSATVTLLNLGK